MIPAVSPFPPFSGPDGYSGGMPAVEPPPDPGTVIAESGNGALSGEGTRDQGASGFLQSASQMVSDALANFREAAGRAFGALGLDEETISEILNSLIDPIRDALESGGSFVANLMFATAVQQSVTGPGGSEGSFELVAQSLTIEVNHATGSVSIAAEHLEIEAKYSSGSVESGGKSGLIDTTDQQGADYFNPIDLLTQFLDANENLLRTPDPTAPPPAAAQTGPAQVTVKSFEQFLNELGEKISRIRLDAIVPLVLQQLSEPQPAPEPQPDGSILV